MCVLRSLRCCAVFLGGAALMLLFPRAVTGGARAGRWVRARQLTNQAAGPKATGTRPVCAVPRANVASSRPPGPSSPAQAPARPPRSTARTPQPHSTPDSRPPIAGQRQRNHHRLTSHRSLVLPPLPVTPIAHNCIAAASPFSVPNHLHPPNQHKTPKWKVGVAVQGRGIPSRPFLPGDV